MKKLGCWILSCALFFTACNLRKSAGGGENFINDDLDDGESLMTLVNDSLFQGNYVYIKSTVKTKIDKEPMSFKVSTKLVRDTAILLSITKGIPVAKILITKDSIKVRNDLEQTVIMEDFEYIETYLNFEINFEMLQAMILGNPHYYYDKNMYKYHDDKPYHLLTSISKRRLKKISKDFDEEEFEENELETNIEEDETLKILIQALWFNGFNGKLKSLFIREPKQNRKMWLDYGDLLRTGGQAIPSSMNIKIKAKSEKKMLVEIFHTKVYLKDYFKLKFKVPEKYEIIH